MPDRLYSLCSPTLLTWMMLLSVLLFFRPRHVIDPAGKAHIFLGPMLKRQSTLGAPVQTAPRLKERIDIVLRAGHTSRVLRAEALIFFMRSYWPTKAMTCSLACTNVMKNDARVRQPAVDPLRR